MRHDPFRQTALEQPSATWATVSTPVALGDTLQPRQADPFRLQVAPGLALEVLELQRLGDKSIVRLRYAPIEQAAAA